MSRVIPWLFKIILEPLALTITKIVKASPSGIFPSTRIPCCDYSLAYPQYTEAPPHHDWWAQSFHGQSSAPHSFSFLWRSCPPLSLHGHPSSACQWGESPQNQPHQWSIGRTHTHNRTCEGFCRNTIPFLLVNINDNLTLMHHDGVFCDLLWYWIKKPST